MLHFKDTEHEALDYVSYETLRDAYEVFFPVSDMSLYDDVSELAEDFVNKYIEKGYLDDYIKKYGKRAVTELSTEIERDVMAVIFAVSSDVVDQSFWSLELDDFYSKSCHIVTSQEEQLYGSGLSFSNFEGFAMDFEPRINAIVDKVLENLHMEKEATSNFEESHLAHTLKDKIYGELVNKSKGLHGQITFDARETLREKTPEEIVFKKFAGNYNAIDTVLKTTKDIPETLAYGCCADFFASLSPIERKFVEEEMRKNIIKNICKNISRLESSLYNETFFRFTFPTNKTGINMDSAQEYLHSVAETIAQSTILPQATENYEYTLKHIAESSGIGIDDVDQAQWEELEYIQNISRNATHSIHAAISKAIYETIEKTKELLADKTNEHQIDTAGGNVSPLGRVLRNKSPHDKETPDPVAIDNEGDHDF